MAHGPDPLAAGRAMVNLLSMFTSKQESVALRALISHPDDDRRLASVREETGLGVAQARALLDHATAMRKDRGAEARTFYSVACSLGEDVAGYTVALQAFMAAGSLWFGFFLLYDGRPFVGVVCFGLMVALLRSAAAGYRQHQRNRAPQEAASPEPPQQQRAITQRA